MAMNVLRRKEVGKSNTRTRTRTHARTHAHLVEQGIALVLKLGSLALGERPGGQYAFSELLILLLEQLHSLRQLLPEVGSDLKRTQDL